MKEFIPEFLNIPYFLILDKRITYIDIKVYGVILWYIKTTKLKKCFVSNGRIASLISPLDINRKKCVIQGSISRLEKLGYLKRYFDNKENKFMRTEIKLIDNSNPIKTEEKVSKGGLSTDGKGLCTDGGGGYVQMVGGLCTDSPSNNNKKEVKDIYISEGSKTPTLILKKIIVRYKIRIAKKATSEEVIITSGIKKLLLDKLQIFKPVDLFLAIEGFANNGWQMKENGHRGISWFFKDTARLEQYIGLYNKARDQVFIAQTEEYLNKQ